MDKAALKILPALILSSPALIVPSTDLVVPLPVNKFPYKVAPNVPFLLIFNCFTNAFY